MTPAEFGARLLELLALPTETEWVEFKHNNTDPERIGEYLSALSNSAALHRKPHGYIVWGIEDGTRAVQGTTFQPHRAKGAGNEALEPWLARLLSPRIDFRIHEFIHMGQPIVMFEVQAASSSPVAFSGREWIRVGSHKKPLKEYPEKERKLWRLLSAPTQDWTAQIIDGATFDDLDQAAVAFARQEYRSKNPALVAEVDAWDDRTFLNKAKVCIDGRITRAAIILLGKPESTHHLSPTLPQLTWILKDDSGTARDYKHFDPPFLLAVDRVSSRIRNLTCRILPKGSLFPVELPQYDDWVLREILHNAIAHQDYSRSGRISVVEFDSRIVVANPGNFLPGNVEDVIRRDAPFSEYRNPFLAQAMVGLKMIDTVGSGIKRVYQAQKKRSFPMPDYDLAQGEEVQVSIIGKVIDEKYTQMLMARSDLDLWEVIALDKVQKGKPISENEFRSLKAKKLIEGRRPKLIVSESVAAATETLVDYLKRRGIDKAYCQKIVIELLQKQGQAIRPDFDNLLRSKLSEALDDDQKRNFITNLLQALRRDGVIQPVGGKRGKGTLWELCRPTTERLP